MSAETALNKWSEVFLINVYYVWYFKFHRECANLPSKAISCEFLGKIFPNLFFLRKSEIIKKIINIYSKNLLYNWDWEVYWDKQVLRHIHTLTWPGPNGQGRVKAEIVFLLSSSPSCSWWFLVIRKQGGLWYICQQSEGGSVKTCPEARGPSSSPRAGRGARFCWSTWPLLAVSSFLYFQQNAGGAAVAAESFTTEQVCKINCAGEK